MSALARTDTSLVGRWWWTVDRWLLSSVIAIAIAGAILTMAASPPVAERMGFDTFHFAKRQIIFIIVSTPFNHPNLSYSGLSGSPTKTHITNTVNVASPHKHHANTHKAANPHKQHKQNGQSHN